MNNHAKTSNPQAVAKFQVILMILSTYISARIHGECCTATSVISCS